MATTVIPRGSMGFHIRLECGGKKCALSQTGPSGVGCFSSSNPGSLGRARHDLSMCWTSQTNVRARRTFHRESHMVPELST